MSDTVEDQVVESKATPEQQAEALKMGWFPPEKYKGPPDRFVDADKYLERGQELLPILKANNKRLQAQVDSTAARLGPLEAALAKANKTLEEIDERHAVDVQKALERDRKDLKTRLAAASEAGDHELVADLTEQMSKTVTAVADNKAKVDEPVTQNVVIDPATKAFNTANPWFGADGYEDDTALLLGTVQKLRKGYEARGEALPSLTEFYEEALEEFNKKLGKSGRSAPQDKVASGRNGSGEGGGGSGNGKDAKTYASMPADAKAACDAEAKRFVGEGKRYKDIAAWRSQYAGIYFEER